MKGLDAWITGNYGENHPDNQPRRCPICECELDEDEDCDRCEDARPKSMPVPIRVGVGVLLLLTSLVSAQEVRRPVRRVPERTATPTQTPTVTPTPTPADPCSECPDPDSFICAISWAYCVQCWEDCGQPIATPTPTPTATPTPPPWPECAISAPGGEISMVAIYAHESTTKGVRYTYQTNTETVIAGSIVSPCPCEGFPIGFEWYSGEVMLRGCGDTGRVFASIFADGFESGDFRAWTEVKP